VKAGSVHPVLRQKLIPLILNSEKIHSNSINVIKILDVVIKNTEDQVMFCKYRGPTQLQQLIDYRIDLELDVERLAVVVGLALGVLMKGLSWYTDENILPQFKQLRATLLQSWEVKSKLALLQTLFGLIKKCWSYEAILEQSFGIIEVMCSLDDNCLNRTLRELLSQTKDSGTPMEIQETNETIKNFQYYSFIQSICLIAMASKESNHVVFAVEIAVKNAFELLHKPQINTNFFVLLTKMWDDPATKDIAQPDQRYFQLLTEVLMTSYQQLDNPACESFVKKLLQEKDKLPTPINTMATTLHSQLQPNVELLQQGVADKDMDIIELSIVNMRGVLKAIQLIISEANAKEAFSATKELLTSAAKLIQDEQVKSISQTEEVGKLLAQLLA